MQKNLKITNFFILIAITISVTLAIILGIQALTKSMKLNISFSANPVICCEIQIKGENESKFTPIFNNSATSPEIGEGVQLSGNTLTLNNDYCNSFGNSFFMKIQNLTSNSAIYITHSGGALSYSESTITNIPLSYEETSVEMKVSLIEALPLTLNMSILNEFSLADTSVGVGIDASNSNLIYLGEKYYVNPSEENVVVKFKNLDGYSDNISLSNLTINGQSSSNYSFDSSTNTLTISKEYVSGSIIWSGEAEVKSAPTLTINWSGTPYNSSDSQRTLYMSIAYGEDLTSSSISYPTGSDPNRYFASITGEYTNYSMSSTDNQTQTKLEIEKNMGVIVYASAANWNQSGPGLQITINSKSGISTYNEIKPYNSILNAIFFTMPDDDVTLDITATKYGDWCFVAGTQVYTETGYKNIEDIRVGDMVWTLNEKTNQFELKEVLYPTKNYYTNEIATIVVGGQEITATSGHTFLTKNRDWVAIKYLTQDDILWGFQQDIQITSISVSTYEGYVYNLHLKDNHNYMVGNNKIVAHNSNCK